MKKDDILKLKAATLYIIEKSGGEIDYIHLFKILYFAEREHLAKYGTHLVKDVFCALPKGPVPTFLYDAVKVTSGQHSQTDDLNIIASSIAQGDGEGNFWVKSQEKPDMDELSKADIKILDEMIQRYLKVDYRDLSKESHDTAWQEAWSKKTAAPLDEFSIAKAGGASEGFIEYMKEQKKLDKILEG